MEQKTLTDDLRFFILYGDVLRIIPNNWPLFLEHGWRLFDKRTRIHKIAVELRRAELIAEYGIDHPERAILAQPVQK